MTISELKPGMNDVTIRGKIASLGEPRQIMTKFGTQQKLVEAKLEDATGSIRLPLWGQASEGLTVGQEVEITGAFTKEFRGDLELGIGRSGKIAPVE